MLTGKDKLVNSISLCYKHTFLTAATPSYIPFSSTKDSTTTSSWWWMESSYFNSWPYHLKKKIHHIYYQNVAVINKWYCEVQSYWLEKSSHRSLQTVSKSSEYKSFKVLDFDAPPKIRSNLSSYRAATWLDLGDGPGPLSKSSEYTEIQSKAAELVHDINLTNKIYLFTIQEIIHGDCRELEEI